MFAPCTMTAIAVRPRGAGPEIREPSSALNFDWWAGQVMTSCFGAPSWTPWCGQAALYALNVPDFGCTISTPLTTTPPPTGTSAVAASGPEVPADVSAVAAPADGVEPVPAAPADGAVLVSSPPHAARTPVRPTAPMPVSTDRRPTQLQSLVMDSHFQ